MTQTLKEQKYVKSKELEKELGVTSATMFRWEKQYGLKTYHFDGVPGNWYTDEDATLLRERNEKPWLLMNPVDKPIA